MSNRTAYFYTKRQRERQEKKSNQQYTRRCGQKRKRSHISLFSASSISSEFIEKNSNIIDNVDVQQSNLVQIDTFTSDPLSAITNTFDDDNSNELNDDEILFKMSPSSSSSESSSASSSNRNSSDDEPDTVYAYSYLPDNCRLCPVTDQFIALNSSRAICHVQFVASQFVAYSFRRIHFVVLLPCIFSSLFSLCSLS